MQTADNSGLRLWLIRWLYAAAATHLLVGVLLAWWGNSPLFEDYHKSIELAFWGSDVPTASRGLQVWWIALFGATVQSYAVYMGALVYLGNRYKSSAAWAWMIAGIVLWAPQDIAISLQVGIWSHVWVDSVAVVCLLVPLGWLYRHDRRAQLSLANEPRHA